MDAMQDAVQNKSSQVFVLLLGTFQLVSIQLDATTHEIQELLVELRYLGWWRMFRTIGILVRIRHLQEQEELFIDAQARCNRVAVFLAGGAGIQTLICKEVEKLQEIFAQDALFTPFVGQLLNEQRSDIATAIEMLSNYRDSE